MSPSGLISPEKADCCRADLLFVSTGVILPFVSALKFVGLDEDDLPRSSGAKPLLIVFPYRSSILLGSPLWASHMALNAAQNVPQSLSSLLWPKIPHFTSYFILHFLAFAGWVVLPFHFIMMRKYLKNRFIVYQFELLHAYKLRLASKYSDWPIEGEIWPGHRAEEKP